MKLSELCSLAGIECPAGYSDTEISSIVTDSRRVCAGCMYICIRGITHDGHRYAADAVSMGASVIVCDNAVCAAQIPDHVAVICVGDTRAAMAHLYSAWYGDPQKSMKMIGVTGTNGKTSVSRMIYEILYHSGKKVGLIGTTGNLLCGSTIDIRSDNELANLTTPDPQELYKIFSVMKEHGAEYVVMEVSSHSLALHKVDPIFFEIAVFTNLTPEHLDFHGNMDEYFRAKSLLFDMCRRAVINCDDKYGKLLSEKHADIALTCSAKGGDTAVTAEKIRIGSDGIEYKILHPRMRTMIRCAIPGEFTVMNSLEAVTCAHELGISASDIKASLASVMGVEGRLERVKLDKKYKFSVFIDYAHTPDALENLLRTARGFSEKRQRIILLFGCGGDRDRSKRSQMGRIASSMADFVIITSDNSRSENASDIISEIMLGVDKEACFTVIEDRARAIEYAVKQARNGDLILLAGKGHEKYEITNEGKKYFCESELVIKFAEKYHSEDI